MDILFGIVASTNGNEEAHAVLVWVVVNIDVAVSWKATSEDGKGIARDVLNVISEKGYYLVSSLVFNSDEVTNPAKIRA